MASLAKFLRWAIPALFGTILIPIAIDYFKKTNPTAADYDSTFGAVMAYLIAFANLPWVYPLAFVLGGIMVGVWLNSIARRLDSTRSTARKSLGHDFLDLGQRMHTRQNGFHSEWPQNVAQLSPEMMSLQIAAAKFGIWSPGPSNLNKSAGFVIGYFMTVGQFLADGHFSAARQAATNIQKQF